MFGVRWQPSFPARTALAVLTLLSVAGAHEALAAGSWTRALSFDPADVRIERFGEGESAAAQLKAGGELRLLEQTGSPVVPYQSFTFVLPQGTRIASASVTGAEWTTLGTGLNLTAASRLRASDGVEVSQQYFTGLTAKSAFPPVLTRVGGQASLHGYSLGSVDVYPVQVQADGEVRMMLGGSLEIELADHDGEIVRRRVAWPGQRERDAAAVRVLVDNPEDMTVYAPPPGISPDLLASGDAPGRLAAKVPTIPEGPVDYLIITTDALASEFQRLADDKTTWGLPAGVITISAIEANYRRGADTQETIRQFLKEVYADWGLRYVLLGGDAHILPTRFVRSTFYPPGSFTTIPTDLYFSALDGNWNDDGDGQYGEAFITFNDPGDDVDFASEIAIGRAPLSSVAQVEAFVDKLLEYEAPSQTGWVSRALFLAEVLFPQNFIPGNSIILDGAEYAEDIIFNSIISPGNAMESWRLYENYTEYLGATVETKQAAMDSMQTGNFGLVVHEGHGFFFNMSVGDDNIKVGDADILTNSPNAFLLYALNCSSAAYDFDCLLERFVQNTAGGSVGSIGSARAAFPTTANNYQQAFFDEVYVLKTTAAGDAMNASRARFLASTNIETADRWTQFTQALLGDPAMEIWRGPPATPSVFFPGTINQNDDSYAINVSSGGAVEGARVTIQQASGFYRTGLTDASGNFTFDLAALANEPVELRVRGKNLMPTTFQSSVLPAAGHTVGATSSIDDDNSGGSTGNSDGGADAGETIEWFVQYTNNGDGSTVSNLVGTLVAVNAPGATIVDGSVSVGTLSGGASTVPSDGFIVDLAPTVPDGARLEFELQISDGFGTDTQPLELLVRAPQIEVVRVVVDDSAGNGDGVPQNGETFDLRVELKNYGAGASGALTGTLSTGVGSVQLLTTGATWSNLDLKDSAYPAADFSLIENDTSVENYLTLDIVSAQGTSWTHSIELRAPDPPNTPETDTSMGPDTIGLKWDSPFQVHVAGYRVYRSSVETGPFVETTQDALIRTGFFADMGLPQLTRFYYQVTTVDSSGVESVPTAVVSASTAPPELSSAFPIPLDLEVSGPLGVGDVLGNGTMAAVVGSNLVYAIDANGDELVDGDQDSRTLGPISGEGATFTPSGVALANLDGEPGLEIIAGSWDTNEVFVFDADGSTFSGWPQIVNNHNWGTPAVGDLDDDGDMEIVVNTVAGRTYVWNHDGTDFFDGDNDPGTIGVFDVRASEGFNRGTPALADLDGNGTLEVITCENYRDGTDNSLRAISPNGTEPPGWPVNLGPNGYGVTSPAVGDLDDDGDWEIVFPCENDSLYVFHHDGTVASGFPKSFISQGGNINSVTPSPALGDFDENGDLEIVAVSVWNGVRCFIYLMDHDGTVWPGWPVELPGLSEGSPVIGDINGDRKLDIMFGIGGGSDSSPNILYAFNEDGTFVDGFPITLSGPVRGTPTICDFDLDGDVDIVYAGFDRAIHIWDMPFLFRQQYTPWPTFHGNSYRTGVYLEHIVVGVEDDVPVGGRRAQVTLHPNVPNPFNPATTLRFDVPGDRGDVAMVDLAVFDLAGRKVRQLRSGPMAAGQHTLRWDGLDDTGRSVGSGVYFARLTARGESATLKMTLVK